MDRKKIIKKAIKILVDTLGNTRQIFKQVSKIKSGLQDKQDAATGEIANRYEIRKDMWAELHTRLYKENYLISRVILKELEEMDDCKLDYAIAIDPDKVVDYDLDNEEEMKDKYSELVTATNRRVFNLKEQALKLIKQCEDKMLKDKLLASLVVFDSNVIACVAQNIHNQNVFNGKKSSVNQLVKRISKLSTSKARILDV